MEKVSVIIPSNRCQTLTLESLKGISNVEIIVESEGNVSQARNNGVAKATNKIIAVLDDDIEFSPSWFLNHIKSVRNGLALWTDPPCIIFMTKEDYFKAGGFDENLTSGEVQEFFHAMKRIGMEIKRVDTKGIRTIPPTTLRIRQEKYHALVHLRYVPFRKWYRILYWQRNPLKLLKILLWVIYWKAHGTHERTITNPEIHRSLFG